MFLSKATSSQCQPYTGVQHSQYPEEDKGKKDSEEVAATHIIHTELYESHVIQ